MNHNSLKKSLVLSILFFLIALFVLIFLYRVIDSNETKSQATLTEWQTEMSKLNEIKLLNNSAKIISEQKDLLETHFAKNSDAVPFLDMIEKLGPTSGTKVEVTSVGVSPDNVTLLVGLKASGSFENIYKFQALLENSPYEVEFDSIDISKSDLKNDSQKNSTKSSWDGTFKIKLITFIPQ